MSNQQVNNLIYLIISI